MRKLTHDEASKLMLEAGLQPLVPYSGNGDPWLCKCLTCGKEVTPRRSWVVYAGSGCKPCGHDKHRIAESTVREVLLVHGFLLTGVYSGCIDPLDCICQNCNQPCRVAYRSVIDNNQTRCNSCGYGAPIPQVKLLELFTAMEYEIIGQVFSSGKPTKTKCLRCGALGRTYYDNLKQGRRMCRGCSFKRGFDTALPGILYVVENPTINALKVGIMNSHTTRLDEHRRNGWHLVQAWEWSGQLISRLETLILRWLRKVKGIPPAVRKEDMPQCGYSETASTLLIRPLEVIAQIETLLWSTS